MEIYFRQATKGAALAAADKVVPTNNENGVAEAVRYLLSLAE